MIAKNWICLMAMAVALFVAGTAQADFIAYNDMEPVNTPSTNPNITGFALGGTNGLLKDVATGASTGVTMTLSGNYKARDNGASPTLTGDALALFGSGVVTGLNRTGRTFQQAGTTTTLTLTGLNPLGTYDMAFYWSDGDSTAYRMIISDVDAATNASTLARVTVATTGGLTGDTSTYQQGALGSNANGVVRWTGIRPGSDGDLRVSMDGGGANGGVYSAFRLAGTAAVPEPSTYAMALAGLACGGYSLFRRRSTR
ncbi:MAG: PEP-CTERM sorting domain-containing protein [Burkholderiales bacterium]